jgi:thymidylate synthase (FAD)
MKQGSSGVVEKLSFLTITDGREEHRTPQIVAEEVAKNCLWYYEALLHAGVAPEQARMILPQNTMTEWYWTGSLMFFCRVCRERLATGVQQETREIAERIAEIVAPLFPVSWSALMEVEK